MLGRSCFQNFVRDCSTTRVEEENFVLLST